mgnify:CR=1 FL=1
MNDSYTPRISFVHPSFFSDDDDRDAYQKQAEIEQEPIIAINGLDVSDLTEEQFDKEFAKASITLSIDGPYEVVELSSEKQEYASSPVWVAPVLREVRNIDSKRGAYEVAVEERTEFADPRINKIAQKIHNDAYAGVPNGPAKRWSGFHCVLSDEFLQSISYSIPEIEPINFRYSESALRTRQVTFTFTPLDCDPSDDA